MVREPVTINNPNPSETTFAHRTESYLNDDKFYNCI